MLQQEMALKILIRSIYDLHKLIIYTLIYTYTYIYYTIHTMLLQLHK